MDTLLSDILSGGEFTITEGAYGTEIVFMIFTLTFSRYSDCTASPGIEFVPLRTEKQKKRRLKHKLGRRVLVPVLVLSAHFPRLILPIYTFTLRSFRIPSVI
jgi:hypothetical protein